MRPRRSPAVTDTSPEAKEVLGQLLRKAPAWRKLEMVADLNRTLRGLVMSDLSERYPANRRMSSEFFSPSGCTEPKSRRR